MRLYCFSIILGLTTCLGATAAAEWGNLTVRFVYDGQPPKPKTLNVDKDKAVCGKQEVLSESVLVHPENRGLGNVLVWLETEKDEILPVHRSYNAAAQGDVVMAIEECRFVPHVAVVRTTQKFKAVNGDPIGHNARVDFLQNAQFSQTIPTNGLQSWNLSKAEASPAQVVCSIHPWLSGFVLVRDNPYTGISDGSGKIKIENLPAGLRTIRVWHESIGFVQQAKKDGREYTWTRGRFTIDIKPAENYLGEYRLPPSSFRQ
jgi:hypothetical protein